jgi:hypothetical protein
MNSRFEQERPREKRRNPNLPDPIPNGEDRDALSLRDPQQVWDESTQTYNDSRNAERPGKDYDRDYLVRHNDEGAYDVGYSSPRFAKEFKRYSQTYRDNENGEGGSGIDNDFGMSEGGTQQWIGLRNLDPSQDWTRAERRPVATPSHIGKGPKGYTPSAQRIREGVMQALTDDGDVDASDIEVEVDNGLVTLSGSVPAKKMKYLAENCAEAIPGVVDVMNRLRVAPMTENADEFKKNHFI